MENLVAAAKILQQEITEATSRIKLTELLSEQHKLETISQQADFWNDQNRAQETMKRLSALQSRTTPWIELEKGLKELAELASTKDETLISELSTQLSDYQKKFAELKSELKYAGPYDDHEAILEFHAGAGGTDAQDWAQMLLRMYVRWAEKHKLKVTMVEESAGEEAGIKSATLSINGPFVYGKLKGEHGVHRLVRLSPFNADSLRQTSFAKVEVLPKVDQPGEVVVDESELKIDVYRAGGHGGQSVNTTDSAVRVTHLPTGITVSIQNERSQLQNRETAMTILRSRLAQLQVEQHAERLSELKGPNEQAAWGNQIRSYVIHPYKQVKDLRTRHETSDVEAVLDGNIDQFIEAYLESTLSA